MKTVARSKEDVAVVQGLLDAGTLCTRTVTIACGAMA